MILAAVEAGGPLTILAVITVLNAAVAAFYYLRVVVYMFMRDADVGRPGAAPRWAAVERAGGCDGVHGAARAVPDRAARGCRAGRERRSFPIVRASAPRPDRTLGTVDRLGLRVRRVVRRRLRDSGTALMSSFGWVPTPSDV